MMSNAVNNSSALKSIQQRNSLESSIQKPQQSEKAAPTRLLPQTTFEMQKKFTIDKQEYQSVFRVIDKDNQGHITID